MESKSIVKLVTIVGITLISVVALSNYFSLQKAKAIQLEETRRALAIQQEATAREKLVQEEKTHRTEERSKAWHFPWNDTTDNTFNREDK